MLKKSWPLVTLAIIVLFIMCGTNPANGQVAVNETHESYDDSMNVDAALVSVFSEAEATGKHVMIIWGANWCGWCKSLSRTIAENDSVSGKLASDFIVVKVSIGRRGELNATFREDFGIRDLGKFGIPLITVLDPSKNVLVNQSSVIFEADKLDPGTAKPVVGHDPAKINAWLDQFPKKTPQEDKEESDG